MSAERSRGSKLYSTMVADPPWPYTTPGRFAFNLDTELSGDAGSRRRYGSMSLDHLERLEVPAATNVHLYLWTTNTFMFQAHTLAFAWGFRPITICTWGKVQSDGRPSMKMGRYFRGATEHWIFCVRGSLPLQTTEALPTLWLWPRLPHSVKPDAFYDLVEKASPGPYLELFARRQRLGWDTWGDEALGHVSLDTAPVHGNEERRAGAFG